jgi:GAF domain-containing protein
MLEQGHQLEVGGKSMIGRCISDKSALIALDVGEEPAHFENPHLPDTRSEMALPLISRGEIQGALTVQSEQAAAFSEEDVAILQTMADQLANAIGNATLFAQAQSSAALSQALYETSSALSTHVEEEPLLRTIMESIQGTLDCELVHVSIVDELSGTIGPRQVLWNGEFDRFPEWMAKSSYPLDHPDIVADTYRSGQTEIIGEWDERFSRETWQQFGLDRLLRIYAPIKMLDRVLGVIEVAYDKEQHQVVGQGDVETLNAFVDQLASALEQARLFEEAQSRARREQALREITTRVRGSSDPDTIMRTAVRELGAVLGRPTFVQLGDVEEPAAGSGGNGGEGPGSMTRDLAGEGGE